MYSIGLNSYGSLNNDENGTSKASYNSTDARLQIGISEEEQQRLITANDDSLDVPNVHEQMAEIWETIKLKAVCSNLLGSTDFKAYCASSSAVTIFIIYPIFLSSSLTNFVTGSLSAPELTTKCISLVSTPNSIAF